MRGRVSVSRLIISLAMQHRLFNSYTDRDYAVLCGLFESRLMSRAHLAAIYFAGHARMTKKRLQKLESGGLVGHRPRRPGEPKLHFLTKAGYDLLEHAGHLAGYPRFGYDRFRKRVDVSPLTLAHELAVMDVKAAFQAAAREHTGIHVSTFTTWPILIRFRVPATVSGRPWLSPDGFIRLEKKPTSEQRFYLEVDRGTEALSVVEQKAAAYLIHSQSGGTRRPLPFRVLWVFRSTERRDHAAVTFLASRPPILTQAWLTTMNELIADPLGRIWVRPSDFRHTMKAETLLSSPTGPSASADPRRFTHDQSYGQRIQKHMLFDTP